MGGRPALGWVGSTDVRRAVGATLSRHGQPAAEPGWAQLDDHVPDAGCRHRPAATAVDAGHLAALTDVVDAVLGMADLPLPTVGSRPTASSATNSGCSAASECSS